MADDIASLLAGAAKTSADFDFGKIADAYYKSVEEQRKTRAFDAFKEGLPRDPQTGEVDWNAITETAAKTGGLSQLGNVIPLLKFKILRGLVDDKDPMSPASTPGPQSSNDQFPPSTSRQALLKEDNGPSGTPAPPGQNLTGPDVKETGVQYGPTQTSGGGGTVTSRLIAEKTGSNPDLIARSIGVGLDDPINPSDPAVRAKIVQTIRYTQANPQGQPQPQENMMALAAPAQGQPNPLQNFPQVAPSPQGAPQDPMQVPLQQLAAQRLAQMQQPQPQAPVAPQARSPLQPPAGQPAPLTVGPQGNINEATAARYEAVANEAFRKSTIAGMAGDASMAAAFKARAEAAMKQAEIIRGALAKNAEVTSGQKDAAAAGFKSPNAAEVAKAGEVELSKQDVTAFEKRNQGLQSLGDISYNGIQKTQLMKQLTLDPNFYSGPLHEGVKTYNQFKAIFGTNPSTALPQEAFNKVTNDMLTEQIKAMGQSGVGRVLMTEVTNMKNSLASEAITPQSNRALAEILSRVYKQNQDIAEIARNIPRVPGKMNQALDVEVSKYLKANPIFTKQELQQPNLLGAPDAPPQSARWNNQQKRDWATSIGLKPGDPIRFNGQIVAVP